MKKLVIIFLLLSIGTLSFALEVQIPVYYVNAYNFLVGGMGDSHGSEPRGSAQYNLFEMGGGLGADFFIWNENTFGLYFRFNFYKPYKLFYKDDRVDTEFGLGNIGDLKRNLDDSYAFDIYLGIIKKFKVNKFEFPIGFGMALLPPHVTSIKYESNYIMHESIIDAGFIAEFAVRYNITNSFFAQIGGLAGIGLGFGNIYSSRSETITTDLNFSFFSSVNVGIGFTIGKNK